jgi:hypothetical protein
LTASVARKKSKCERVEHAVPNLEIISGAQSAFSAARSSNDFAIFLDKPANGIGQEKTTLSEGAQQRPNGFAPLRRSVRLDARGSADFIR